jgi:hypothetical protein
LYFLKVVRLPFSSDPSPFLPRRAWQGPSAPTNPVLAFQASSRIQGPRTSIWLQSVTSHCNLGVLGRRITCFYGVSLSLPRYLLSLSLSLISSTSSSSPSSTSLVLFFPSSLRHLRHLRLFYPYFVLFSVTLSPRVYRSFISLQSGSVSSAVRRYFHCNLGLHLLLASAPWIPDLTSHYRSTDQ